MLADQRISGLAMIELASRRFPFDDIEVFAKVLGMAARAVLAPARILHYARVIAPFVGNPLANLAVAAEAPKSRRAGPEDVACAALGGTAQIGMRVRKRPGRDLRPSGHPQYNNNQQKP